MQAWQRGARPVAVWFAGDGGGDSAFQRHTSLLPKLSGTSQDEQQAGNAAEVAEQWQEVCGDKLWARSLQIAHSGIDSDSENIMPASVRLLALLCGGIGEAHAACSAALATA